MLQKYYQRLGREKVAADRTVGCCRKLRVDERAGASLANVGDSFFFWLVRELFWDFFLPPVQSASPACKNPLARSKRNTAEHAAAAANCTERHGDTF